MCVKFGPSGKINTGALFFVLLPPHGYSDLQRDFWWFPSETADDEVAVAGADMRDFSPLA